MAHSSVNTQPIEPENDKPDVAGDVIPMMRSDKYWRKTGNLFIETSAGGKASGLMAAPADYILNLVDDTGKSIARFSLDARKFSRLLADLEASGTIRTLTVDDQDKTTGYLVPLSLMPSLLQMMAGIDIAAAPKPSKNKTPIVITTDGSFRPGGHGGGHVILERLGSSEPRDDFRITLTWQATIKDSYESEVRGVLEALKYLEQGRKSCELLIRCDNMGVVDGINRMATQLKHTGRIETINKAKPCAELWQEIADRIQIHHFSCEHARYNPADHDTVECHEHAHHASKRWKEGKGGKDGGKEASR